MRFSKNNIFCTLFERKKQTTRFWKTNKIKNKLLFNFMSFLWRSIMQFYEVISRFLNKCLLVSLRARNLMTRPILFQNCTKTHFKRLQVKEIKFLLLANGTEQTTLLQTYLTYIRRREHQQFWGFSSTMLLVPTTEPKTMQIYLSNH